MEDEISNRVKKFVIKQAAVNEDEVTNDASLENDLGVYGDDAVEFIIAFGKEFNVNVSKFMADDYFKGAGIGIWDCIREMFNKENKKQRKDLKINHLVKAVVAWRLDEEVINS